MKFNLHQLIWSDESLNLTSHCNLEPDSVLCLTHTLDIEGYIQTSSFSHLSIALQHPKFRLLTPPWWFRLSKLDAYMISEKQSHVLLKAFSGQFSKPRLMVQSLHFLVRWFTGSTVWALQFKMLSFLLASCIGQFNCQKRTLGLPVLPQPDSRTPTNMQMFFFSKQDIGCSFFCC